MTSCAEVSDAHEYYVTPNQLPNKPKPTLSPKATQQPGTHLHLLQLRQQVVSIQVGAGGLLLPLRAQAGVEWASRKADQNT